MSAQSMPIDWDKARTLAYEAGRAAAGPAEHVALAGADGRTLAEPLVALADLPAFPTSSIDGWAVRGEAPWRPIGRVLAGSTPPPLTEDGTCVEIATGAMVPSGAAALVRVEESARDAEGRVSGTPGPSRSGGSRATRRAAARSCSRPARRWTPRCSAWRPPAATTPFPYARSPAPPSSSSATSC
ncbi:hypothetical protein Asp14428_47690 [Actinoplanes sp. NBRC 14428]|nr:hypothetical protein Asp14428_47690 [Actinoplanes sp. NBRC 14428]